MAKYLKPATNLSRMKDAAVYARSVYASIRGRLLYRRLSLAEANAFIALGRLEQFMADVDTILAVEATR
jgi:hypothetical protein